MISVVIAAMPCLPSSFWNTAREASAAFFCSGEKV
jgi:hypothetical protein